MSLPWALLLAADSSPTRLFAALSGSATRVHVIDEVRVPEADVPPEVRERMSPPFVRRRVWLHRDSGVRYAFAISYWNADDYEAFMGGHKGAPIGGNMQRVRQEVYRELVSFCHGGNAQIAAGFGMTDAAAGEARMWARTYFMYMSSRPQMYICEVFHPRLMDGAETAVGGARSGILSPP